MASYETLGFIHQRLTEIKETDDAEVYFGGLNIIAVGDFYQLPPVHDRFVFQNERGCANIIGVYHLESMNQPEKCMIRAEDWEGLGWSSVMMNLHS